MSEKREFIYLSTDDPRDDYSISQAKFVRNFHGQPCPKKEVVEKIGVENVDNIDRKIKEMIDWKITLYGKESKKVRFPNIINFFDKNDPDLCISCSMIVNVPVAEIDPELKELFTYPDRFGPSMNNYSMTICRYVDELKEEIEKILDSLD